MAKKDKEINETPVEEVLEETPVTEEAVQEEIPTVTIGVRGMMCSHCTAAVEKACLGVPGTVSAVADLEKKCVTVTGTAADHKASVTVEGGSDLIAGQDNPIRVICTAEDGYLKDVTECLRIEKDGNDARTTEDDGKTWTALSGDTLVSMNLWGFGHGILDAFRSGFPAFLDQNLPVNPMKCEYFLPSVVMQLLEQGKAQVKVLTSPDKWYGVTYAADKPVVMAALRGMGQQGLYPDGLWG